MLKMKEFNLPLQCFSNVCRVCLSKHNVLVDIKEINLAHNLNPNGSVGNVNLITVFQKFCKIEVDVSDRKPQKICEFCINMACKAFNFFQLFLYSNALLDKKLENGKLLQNKTVVEIASTAAGTQSCPDNVGPSPNITAIVNLIDACDNIDVSTENAQVETKPTQNKENTDRQRKEEKKIDIEQSQRKKRKLTLKSRCPRQKRFVPDIFPELKSIQADALRVLLKIKNKNRPKLAPGRPKSTNKPKGGPKLKLRDIENRNDIFKCTLCPKVFHDIVKVIEHRKDEHKDTKQCVLCPKRLSSLYHVATHSPKALLCRICLLYFENRDELDKHKKDIDHTNTRKCPKCQKSFRLPYHVRVHMDRVHHKKKPYQCNTCGILFGYYPNLMRHEINVHGSEKRFLCQECGKNLTTLSELKLHIQRHHNMDREANSKDVRAKKPRKRSWPSFRTKNVECKICQKKFVSLRFLLLHSAIHPEFKDYCCDLCSEIFETKKEYVNHYKTHQIYRCRDPMCDKLFISKQRALCHKYMHVKKFRCHHCNRTFRSKAELEVHLNVHTGDRPFVCDKCGKAFKQAGHLKAHSIAYHGEKKPWQCQLCDKAFYYSHGLRCHMRSHTGEKPFPCPFCKKMFRDTTGRHKHVKKDHPRKMNEFLLYKQNFQDDEVQKVDCESERGEGNETDTEDDEEPQNT